MTSSIEPLMAMQTAISIVEEQQELMNSRVDGWTAQLNAAMGQLADLDVGVIDAPETFVVPAPRLPTLDVSDPPNLANRGVVRLPSPEPSMPNVDALLVGLDAVQLGVLPNAPDPIPMNMPTPPAGLNLPAAPGAHGIDTSIQIDAPPTLDAVTLEGIQQLPAGYTPQFGNAPDAPVLHWDVPMPADPQMSMPTLGQLSPVPGVYSPVVPAAPDRPSIDMQVDLPTMPVVDLPTLGSLKDIPDFTFPTLPDFDGNAPTMDLATPNVFINWTEPTYESELLDDLTAWVRRYMQGGTGLPPHVEDALFARSRDRITSETRQAVQDAVALYAARGFTMPSGMLNKQVNVAREQGRAKAAELNRDILIEATKWEIENIRFAVERGIAIEGLTQNLYENMAKRLFEAARFGAEAQISVYNASVALFNAKIAAFGALREAFRTKLDRALAELEVWKVRAQASTTHNQNMVEVFKAEFIAVQQAVESYKALMEGAKVRVSVIEAQLNAYRADVQVFSEKVGVEKLRVEADESRIRAITSANQSEIEAYKAKLAGEQQNVETYKALMEGARVRAGLLQTRLEGYRAEVQAYSEKNQAERIKVDAADTLTRSVIANNQNAVEIYKAKYEGVRNVVENYKAYMESVRARASVIESQFNGYRTEVQAFGELVNAEKTKIDVYKSQVDAEKTKADLYDSSVRAYAAMVQAVSNRAETEIKGKQLKVEAARVKLAEYQTGLEIWRGKVDAALRQSANELQAFEMEVRAWQAGANVEISNNEVQSRFADMQTRTNIAYSEMQINQYNAKLQHAIQKAQLAMEAAKAIGQYSAQLVAGAMSAINVSAGVTGSGQQSGSHSRNDNYNYEGN